MRDQGSGISSMRYVLWPGALALAAWLFIEGLEARDQHAETRGLIDSTSRQIQDVQRHNDRTRAEIEGIEATTLSPSARSSRNRTGS